MSLILKFTEFTFESKKVKETKAEEKQEEWFEEKYGLKTLEEFFEQFEANFTNGNFKDLKKMLKDAISNKAYKGLLAYLKEMDAKDVKEWILEQMDED